MVMGKVTLKPCPFCGGPAGFEKGGVQLGFFNFRDMTFVRCEDCGRSEGFVFKNKTTAANSWNTRAHDVTTPIKEVV